MTTVLFADTLPVVARGDVFIYPNLEYAGARRRERRLASVILRLASLFFVPLAPAATRFLPVPGPPLTHLRTDYQRPFLYALQEGATSTDACRLLFIDTRTDAIATNCPAGLNASDLAIVYGDTRLYVANWKQAACCTFDLDAQASAGPVALPSECRRLSGGSQGRLLAEKEGVTTSSDVLLLESTSGTTRASWSGRLGDGDIEPTRTNYFHAQNRQLFRLVVTTNAITSDGASEGFPEVGGWDDTVVLSADGQTIFCQGRAIDRRLEVVRTFPEPIRAVSLHGEVAVGTQQVFSTATGDPLLALPAPSSVSAFSGDQRKLYVYDSVSNGLYVVDLTNEIALSNAWLQPEPADGALMGRMPPLCWTPTPVADGYDVYGGAISQEVALAGTGSVTFLGRTTAGRLTPTSALPVQSEYFWRVDALTSSGAVQGAVWRFTSGPVVVQPGEINALTLEHAPTLATQLQVRAVATNVWALTAQAPWLSCTPTSGLGASLVSVALRPEGLSPGRHESALRVESGAFTDTVPVVLQVLTQEVVRVAADRKRARVYALHAAADQLSAVLAFDSASGVMTGLLFVGRGASDMELDPASDDLWCVSGFDSSLSRIALSTFDHVDTIPFNLGLSGAQVSIYQVAPGPSNYVYVADPYYLPAVHILEKGSGQEFTGATANRTGDLTVNGDGASMLAWRYVSGTPAVWRLDCRTTNLTVVDTFDGHISGNPMDYPTLVSPDGAFVIKHYTKLAYSNLASGAVRIFSEALWSWSPDGRLLAAGSNVLEEASGQRVYDLPFYTGLQVFSGDGSALVRIHPTTRQWSMVSAALYSAPPAPPAGPIPTDNAVVNPAPDTLHWTVAERTVRYHVYLDTDAATVGAAEPGGTAYLGATTNAEWSLTHALACATTYYWRVDSVGVYTTTTGTVWTFHVPAGTLSPILISTNIPEGFSPAPGIFDVALCGPALGWTVACDCAWMQMAPTSGAGNDTVTGTYDTATLSPGVYTGRISLAMGRDVLAVPLSLTVTTNPALHPIPGGVLFPSWVQVFDGESHADDRGAAAAMDPLDNVVVAGEVRGSGDGDDMLLLKLDPNGQTLWATNYDGSGHGDDAVKDLGADGLGEIYALLDSTGTNGNMDLVVCKYSADGQFLWEYRRNGTANTHDYATALAVPGTGGVVAAGMTVDAATSNDVFLARLNADGTPAWVTTYNGPHETSRDECNDMSTDAGGSIYLTGTSTYPGPPQQWRVFKYSAGGTQEWSQFWYAQSGAAIAVNEATNVWVVSGGGLLRNLDPATGVPRWERTLTFPYMTGFAAYALLPGPRTQVYVAGRASDGKYRYAAAWVGSTGEVLATATVDRDEHSAGHKYLNTAILDAFWQPYLTGKGGGTLRLTPSLGELGRVTGSPTEGIALAADSTGAVYMVGSSDNFTNQNDLVVVKLAPSPSGDFDADQIPNDWEIKTGGNAYDAVPGQDPDDDSMTTWEEYLADTDPTNGTSALAAPALVTRPDGFLYRITGTSTGRLYDIFWKTNLLDAATPWQFSGYSRLGTGGVLEIVTNMPTVDVLFLRSGARLP